MMQKRKSARLLLNGAVIMAVIGLIGLGSFLWGRTDAPEIHIPQPEPIAMIHENFDPFTFKTLAGDIVNSNDLKGQLVLLNFWASWCAPCIVELPQLYELARQYNDMNIILMSVDFDKNNIDIILKKLKLHKDIPANIIIAWDPKKEISKDIFGTIVYPETVIINPEGVMVHKIAGAVNWLDDDIQAIIKKASE